MGKIKFKEWLICKEGVENLANAQSWLDDTGIFHPINRTAGGQFWVSHGTWALQHNFKIDELFEQGWMRVTSIGRTLYVSNDSKVLPNFKQRQNLIDFALISGKFDELVYDNGTRENVPRENVLWAKENNECSLSESKKKGCKKCTSDKAVNWRDDILPNGSVYFFEYHCVESHSSAHAQWWYRSHQKVKILSCTKPEYARLSDGSKTTFSSRCSSAMLLGYNVSFADGFKGEVMEDELMINEDEFSRPDPPEI